MSKEAIQRAHDRLKAALGSAVGPDERGEVLRRSNALELLAKNDPGRGHGGALVGRVSRDRDPAKVAAAFSRVMQAKGFAMRDIQGREGRERWAEVLADKELRRRFRLDKEFVDLLQAYQAAFLPMSDAGRAAHKAGYRLGNAAVQQGSGVWQEQR